MYNIDILLCYARGLKVIFVGQEYYFLRCHSLMQGKECSNTNEARCVKSIMGNKASDL